MLAGEGRPDGILSENETCALLKAGLEQVDLDGIAARIAVRRAGS